MSQFSDTIRPRYRRRTAAPPTDPAANRAEQSTRILIRVPLIQLEAIATEGAGTRSQESGDKAQASGFRVQGADRRLAGRPTACGDAASGVSGQESGIRSRESASPAHLRTPAPAQASIAAPVKNEPAVVDSNSIRTVRIDQGHVEATLPHLAPTGWMSHKAGCRVCWSETRCWQPPRSLWWWRWSSSGSIIVVREAIPVRRNHRIRRLRSSIRKAIPRRAPTMKSPTDGSANSHAPAERSASERSLNTAKLPAGNATAGGSPSLENPGRLKGVRAAGENESPPGTAPWKLPAATNTPAAINARAPQSSVSLFNPPPADGVSFYSAPRKAPLPANTFMPRQPTVTNGAAFENRIEKAPFEVPR